MSEHNDNATRFAPATMTPHDNDPGNRSRRNFVRKALALSSLGLASRLDVLNMVASAEAQVAPGYKALVCVFMFGGNDGNNTIIPYDSAGYNQYAAVRTAASNTQ